jgi:hypothetical protein
VSCGGKAVPSSPKALYEQSKTCSKGNPEGVPPPPLPPLPALFLRLLAAPFLAPLIASAAAAAADTPSNGKLTSLL